MEDQQTLTLKNNKDVELKTKMLDHSQRWMITEGESEKNKGYYQFKSFNNEGKEDGKVLTLGSNEKLKVEDISNGKSNGRHTVKSKSQQTLN